MFNVNISIHYSVILITAFNFHKRIFYNRIKKSKIKWENICKGEIKEVFLPPDMESTYFKYSNL